MADQTLLTSAARTATVNSAEFSWDRAKAYMVLDVTAVTSTPGLTPKIQVYDSTSGQWITIASYTQVNPTGATTYTFCASDQSFAPSTVTETEQCYLTARMRVRIEHADADSATYTVSFLEVNAT